jgi:SAM-dependent methyltransferase
MYPESRLTHNWLIKRAANDRVREHAETWCGTVLDLGCGTRPFQADIEAHAAVCFGVDWSHTLHHSKPDLVADLNHPLPFADAAVDHVVSFEVIEHLAEPTALLCEAFRVLRNGGTLTLSTPFQWWVHEAPWDYQRFTRFGLEHQLQKAGFADVFVRETTGFWGMWILKLNYQLHRLVRGPRIVRAIMRVFLVPLWWIGQMLATRLDRIWREPRETAGYFATARKP